MTFVINGAEAGNPGRAAGRVQACFFGGLCVSPLIFGAIVDLTGSHPYAWCWTLATYAAALTATRTLIRG